MLAWASSLLLAAIACGIGSAAECLASASSDRPPANRGLPVSVVAARAPARLFPHGAGDVVVTITNPDPFPVTISKVQLPPATRLATGYATAAMRTPVPACGPSRAGSDVSWRSSEATRRSTRALARPLVVAGKGAEGDPLTVTLVGAAVMGTTASPACEGVYLMMPPLVGLSVSGGGAARASLPTATDEWGG